MKPLIPKHPDAAKKGGIRCGFCGGPLRPSNC